jgi:Cu/Ag efflux protein CusF
MVSCSTHGGRPARPALVVLTIALAAIAPGCRDGGGSRSGDGAAANPRRYTVRGEIVRLPAPSGGARQVAIRHEPIDDFVNEAGAVVGMDSMVMQFDVAPAVALDEVRLGDKVEVRLAVAWSPPLLRIEELRELPADTVLRLGPAQPKPGPHPR